MGNIVPAEFKKSDMPKLMKGDLAENVVSGWIQYLHVVSAVTRESNGKSAFLVRHI